MASVLDLGLLQYFGVIFPVLLIFVLVYAILQKTKFVSESMSINAIIAVCAAIMASLSDSVIQLIVFISPWFVLTFILVLLFLLVMKTFGTTDAQILDVVTRDAAVTWGMLGVAIVIIFAGFAVTFGQDLVDQSSAIDGDGTAAGDDFQSNIFETIFHPKILGVLVLFAICVMAIALLTGKS